MTVRLFCAGSNARDQLSTGDTEDKHTFTQALGLRSNISRILNVSGGSNHTLVLLEIIDETGTTSIELWGCGDGRRGQLGSSLVDDTWTTLQHIELDLEQHDLRGYTVRLASASWETSYLVLSCPGKSDILLSMGSNDYGDLGTGSPKSDSENSHAVQPVGLDDLFSDEDRGCTRITRVATGLHHVLVLLEIGRKKQPFVVGWGMSRHGQLGHGTSTSSRLPPYVSTPCIVALDPSLGRVTSASLGHHHTVLLHENGQLTALGSNRKGQLRSLEQWGDIHSLDCSWNGTYVVVGREDGLHILSAGDNSKGQLGFRSSSDMFVQFPFTPATHRLLDMACGSEHVLCLFQARSAPSDDWSDRSPTEVWGWGWNEHGNLGLGNTEDSPVPVKIWPSQSAPGGNVKAIWAGCATSWIAVER
ncbi:RCC1/BLIP-II [Heliocybe sulcata]|uniref:RCC1/BLIP-II n=1 Tax=Heliocybe sulcata TaxID=5364 RepID=A0A5C3NF97_9AGAM|nr:RCC1/BLIP-II [Heliocybe sulcata]